MDQSSLIGRRVLSALAGAVVIYCLIMLAVLVTIPDLRLRFVLVDPDSSVTAQDSTERQVAGSSGGIVVRQADSIQGWGAELIAPGDRLLTVGDVPIGSYLDYARELLALRNAEILPGGKVPAGTDPVQSGLPALVQDEGGTRWVRIRFQQKSGRILENALALQAVPLDESAMTFVWFLLQLLIFGVGWLAFWTRPFDRSARLFFAMCLATLGAFVGGFHWWITVGSFWLTIPFVICAVLLPVIAFHFFLTFPRPKTFLMQSPGATLTAIYAVPVLTLGVLLVAEISLWTWVWQPDSAARTAAVLWWLKLTRTVLYVYLAVAALYFLATLASLVHARFSTRNPVELSQVNSILWAGFIALGFIGYTLWLAYFYRTEFALGGGRVPMFLASLVFMLAYAVGIVRFKLMLVHQVITRGMWYYFLTYGSTAVVAAAIAVGALAISRHSHLLPNNLQAVLVAAVLTVGVILALWLRDGWQRTIDRRFFREKYRLDKALCRMNRAEGQLTDTQVLAERMLNSCRDVLQADRAALYLRGDKSLSWRLLSAPGKRPAIAAESARHRHASASLGTRRHDPADSRRSRSPSGTNRGAATARGTDSRPGSGQRRFGIRGAGAEARRRRLLRGGFDVPHGARADDRRRAAQCESAAGSGPLERRAAAARRTDRAAEATDSHAADGTGGDAARCAGGSGRGFSSRNDPRQQPRIDAGDGDGAKSRGERDVGVAPRRKRHGQGTGGPCDSRKQLAGAGPFIAVHCAALSPSLLESELFGHVKGAFTGAQADRRGRFELAHGGTIFLDEIGDISPETQVKLLRVLQQHEFERVGGTDTVRVDVRIIAATHQNLEQLIAEGKFREDLYYRLNVISITLPPLRERPEDLLELSMQFLKRTAARSGKPLIGLDDDAVDALVGYGWPGNVRELENVIERAGVLADGPTVTVADLPADLRSTGRRSAALSMVNKPVGRSGRTADRGAAEAVVAPPWKRLDEQTERELLVSAMEQCQGNKARAARLLGLPRSTFFSKLKKFAIAE